MTLRAVNPATGDLIREYSAHDPRESRAIAAAAGKAFTKWSRTDFPLRAERLRALATELRRGAEEYARLMAVEMGKPVPQGRAEVEKCAWVAEYYAEEGAGFLADVPVTTDAGASFVAFRPLGVVLAVMPWNFPFWQVIRAATPALMAGNTIVLKHASNVPGCALALEELFRRAGFPDDAFRAVLVDGKGAQRLIRHRAVRAVTLTGSSVAGQAVAKQAGASLKKTVLELGGSDPYLVLADADLDLAVETCAASRLINSGQSCIAAKRFIVVAAVREEFERRFVERMGRARMGDPLDPATDVGPQARRDLRDALHAQVTRSRDAGARLLLGGEVPAGAGAYYPPTVLTDVASGMAGFDEELFGPVAAIVPVKDEKAGIRAANDSRFGLGAAVFTRDEARGRRIAATALEAGSCFVNGLVKSDPRLPFGGIKESGYGRELGEFGIREFVNAKTVWIR
ncbi:MAG TPA: NAD-dependent succinate-semialdehyde dehydrogenase [Gemmatimonadales bacterium]|nr:NAD-dependent succinate-semialdehyde dehydrogenase [Gemmatimonadales bacterium]